MTTIPPPGSPYGMPPQPPQRKRHLVRRTFAILGALIGLAIIVSAIAGIAGAGSRPVVSHAPSTTAPAAPASPAAAPATPSPTTITFTVTGAGEPNILYGSDSDNRDGGGQLGELGDGNSVPWSATLPFDPSAMFYDINAQLEGGGDITCTITVSGPGLQPLVVSRAHASGGHNVCDAQAAPVDSSGTSWTNET